MLAQNLFYFVLDDGGKKLTLRLGELDVIIDEIAPRGLAESWDNVGLQVGDAGAAVRKIGLCVDVTGAVVRRARQMKADVIVSHHPLIFRAISKLILTEPAGRALRELVVSGIGLIVAHTNLDKSPEGTNKALALAVGIKDAEIIFPESAGGGQCKFVVFVPKGHEGKVIEAIARGGGGVIGNYSHCSFRSEGRGTFLPLEGAKPFMGESGKLEEAEEWRLEAVVPREKIRRVVSEVIRAHPYEEVAYDVYSLEDVSAKYGLGMEGALEKAVAFSTFVSRVKSALKINSAEVVGKPPKRVQRVAVCSGGCGEVVTRLGERRVDVLLTGEINHHEALEAEARGMCVLLGGHYATELPGMSRLGELLKKNERVKEEKVKVVVIE